MSKKDVTTNPNYAGIMSQIIDGTLSLEDGARMLGVSPRLLLRKPSTSIIEAMDQGARLPRKLNGDHVQGALEEVAGRATEIYEIALDHADLETALAANTQLHGVIQSMAKAANIGGESRDTPGTVNIGRLDMKTVIGIPGLKLHHPDLLLANAEQN